MHYSTTAGHKAQSRHGSHPTPSAAEKAAQQAAAAARAATAEAVDRFYAAGYGNHVTDPLRDALANIDFSIREVAA